MRKPFALLCLLILCGAATAHATDTAAPASPEKTAVKLYARGVYYSYKASYDSVLTLQKAVYAFLATPTSDTLQKAQAAWTDAHKDYELTEVFRGYGGPIDAIETAVGEGPVNSETLDYVETNAASGLVNDVDTPITSDTLRQRNNKETPLMGWDAVRFMLWGETGARPASDYLPGTTICERRRTYLKVLVQSLVDDMAYLTDQWTAKTNYAASFTAQDSKQALGEILEGLRAACERFSLPTNSQEEFAAHLQGFKNVYDGTYPGLTPGTGVGAIIALSNPSLNAQIEAVLASAEDNAAFAELLQLLPK